MTVPVMVSTTVPVVHLAPIWGAVWEANVNARSPERPWG